MAKSNKERQAEYRAKRKQQGFCAWPGCQKKPRKYALCSDHRKENNERRQEVTQDAKLYEELLEEVRFLRQYRRLYDESQNTIREQRQVISTLQAKVDNICPVGMLPEGRPDSVRLEQGKAAPTTFRR